MAIDLRLATAFLETLTGEWDPEVTFQTFDDSPKKDPRLARIFHGSLRHHAEALKKLNAQGAGIFVCVNETDLKGRKKGNIVRVRGVWIDFDGGRPLPKFDKHKPTIIVKTPNGWHCYFILVEGAELDPEEGERLNKAAALKWGGDTNSCDRARVMRIPGFDHCKEEPTFVQVQQIDERNLYTPEQLRELFPLPEEEPKKPAPKPPRRREEGRGRYGEVALERECERVRAASEGERNRTLNRAAFALGQLVAGGELVESDARAELLAAADAAGLGAKEAEQTINSGFRAGADDPRAAPKRGPMEMIHSKGWEDDVPPPDEPPPGFEEDQRAAGDAPPVDEPPPWQQLLRLKMTDKGAKITRDPFNLMMLLANEESWAGCIGYDQMTYRVAWKRQPPELRSDVDVPRPEVGPFVDWHWSYVQHWFAKRFDVVFSKDSCYAAIEQAAHKGEFHPVCDYLDSLEWDGVERLPTFLARYFGAERNRVNADIGIWWMTSAVARVMSPGCQADHVIIFEGPQGKGKSTALRILAGAWYQGSLGNIAQKEGIERIQGSWLVEIAELDALRRADVTRIKDFLTQQVDVFRPAYGRVNVTRKRQCVFAGTTNDATYLRDATGGRRFWPVRCGAINRDALAADRDQLWAEALARFGRGESWWPQTDDQVEKLSEVQAERTEDDPWHEQVAAYLERPDRTEVGVPEILEHLEVPRDRWDRLHAMRVGSIVAAIPGWIRKRRRREGKVVWRYVRRESADLDFE